MIKNCENCQAPFDSNRTQPEMVGSGDERVFRNFERLCKTSNLCEPCLVKHIEDFMKAGSAPQD